MKLTWRGWLDAIASLIMIVAAGFIIRSYLVSSSRSAPKMAVPKSPVSISGSPQLGSPTAKMVLIEYSDFQCPFCARFVQTVLPSLKERYIDTGQLLLVFRHVPLQIHPNARGLAELSQCANRQGQFWPVHDQLFAHPFQPTDDVIASLVSSGGMNASTFETCRAKPSDQQVATELADAERLGINVTPSFFLGRRVNGSEVRAVQALSGVGSVAAFSASIDLVAKSVR